MASNDSGAAVAAASAPVNAVAPILPPSQAENKTPEAAQANHNTSLSTTTEQATAAVPATSDTPAASVKEVPKTQPASNNTTVPTIPSSTTTTDSNTSPSVPVSQPAEASDSSQSQPKPSEERDKNPSPAATATPTTTSEKTVNDTSTTNATGSGDDKPKGSETVQNQEDKKSDPQVAEPAAETKTNNSDNKPEPAVSKSPSSTTNNTKAEKPPLSGSETSEKSQNAAATPTTTPSPRTEASSLKTTSSTPTTAPATSKPVATIKPMIESTTTATNDAVTPMDTSTSKSNPGGKSSNKRPAEDSGDDGSDKKLKSSSTASSSSTGGQKESNKSAEQILENMEKTFDQRRKIITKQMPTIPELKSMYPELFMGKQLLLEFQRITKIDIDQKIQEFCVRYATAVIEMARSNKAAAPVLARWEQAKQENETLKQYWDMVTALCLLPLHFGENFVEMVLEIGEDDEVKAQGKIVPTLVARGNIFRTDEFFLIAENTIVQEFEEFTIAFASLYSSYWVFNMVYPETIENTYNYIQRCIVRQREPGAISAVCKNFTKSLQKWNKDKEAK